MWGRPKSSSDRSPRLRTETYDWRPCATFLLPFLCLHPHCLAAGHVAGSLVHRAYHVRSDRTAAIIVASASHRSQGTRRAGLAAGQAARPEAPGLWWGILREAGQNSIRSLAMSTWPEKCFFTSAAHGV